MKKEIINILDLFSGDGGDKRREKIEALGYRYVTLDKEKKFKCDIYEDVFSLNEISGYDFIWASPPCQSFSVSSIGKHWNIDNTPKTREAEESVALVRHTLRLLNNSGAKWVIENPVGKLRKLNILNSVSKNTVTYCQYGYKVMKPTDIWYHGFEWTSRPMCKKGDSCHISAPRGSQSGTQNAKVPASQKGIVPFDLWKEILENAFKYERK